jgi:hypothetical protein
MYEHFSFRLEGEENWTKIADALPGAYVSSVENPTPEPKLEYQDIAGASGSIDLTENNGRVFFNNKPVEVVVGVANANKRILGVVVKPLDWIILFKNGYSFLNGRRVEFTFSTDVDASGNTASYQVGRLTFNCDYKEHFVTFSFEEVEPYRFGETKTISVACLTNYELKNNSDSWVYGGTVSPSYSSDAPLRFVYSFNEPQGKVFRRVKGVGAYPNQKMLFGVRSVVGGKVWFVDAEGNKSRTVATVIEPEIGVVPSGSNGEIVMQFTVDGSHYEWVTVNGTRAYLPTIRCEYVLSNYVQVNASGKIVNTETANATLEIQSNVVLRPLFEAAEGLIICDGVAAESPNNVSVADLYEPAPEITLNGIGADRSKEKVDSVFCWIPKDNSDAAAGSCSMRYTESEVF